MKPFRLHRRTMLRGAIGGSAVALGLPVLEAMLGGNGDAYADGSGLPCRMVTWFFGNGCAVADVNNTGAGIRFAPGETGPGFAPTPQLQPLADRGVLEYCSVLSGFDIAAAAEHRRGHHDGVAGFFSGYPFVELPPNGANYASKFGGPSIDQVAAERLAGQTVIPSIQMAISKRIVGGEGPTLQYLSHQGPDQPLAPYFDPREAWDKLFGTFTVPDDPAKPARLSALDAVREDVQRLQMRVGANDRMRLESHLDAVAQLRGQIDALAPVCTLPPQTPQSNDDIEGQEQIEAVNAVMSELLAIAFACDITRVGSIQFTGSVGYTVFNNLGLTRGHHDLTHDAAENEAVDQATIFTMDQFGVLLAALRDMPEGDGNVLDNSCILLGSDAAAGLTHSVFDQPCIVAGGGGGMLTHPGVHYRSDTGENASDILLSCLQTVDPAATEAGGGIGRSTTPCSALQG